MDRSDEINLPSDTDWLHDPDAQTVCRAIEAAGARIFFVGGCVRDALLRLGGGDVDLASDALPQDVIRLAEAAGLKAVPTGIDHGTVTIVSGGKGYEVTTFRKDVETDGRRAVVSFSTDMVEDARRRDFTMNALYATASGQVIDPLGNGIADCLTRRVRFIEDAATRIREDYLRVLRYFRFHAWYAEPTAGFDPDALDAIASNTDGLETLSAERIGAEMVRLLCAPDPAAALAVMRQTGVLHCLLPGADDRYVGPVCHLEDVLKIPPDPILRLAALGGENLVERLRLSKVQARRLALFSQVAFDGNKLAEVSYRFGADIAQGAAILRAAFAEQPLGDGVKPQIALGAEARFPVSAQDLMPALSGKALGERLAALEARWIASGFSLSREELLSGS